MKVVQDHDKCEEYEKLLKIEYMSSESEAEDEDKNPVFAVHVPKWRSKKLTNIFNAMDTSAIKSMSKIARKQFLPRYKSEVKDCETPRDIPEEFGWIICKL